MGNIVIKETIVKEGFYKKGVSYKGIIGKWTKYGGAANNFVQADVGEEWACQSCGARHPKVLSPYRFEYPEGEWIRVCATCLFEECRALFNRLSQS